MKTIAFSAVRAAIFVLATVLVLSPGNGFSSESPDDDDDEDEVTQQELLEYRRSRDILTFEEILKIIRTDIEGEIIEIEFEIEGDVAIYEITFIDPTGQVLEMYMDAKTGIFFEGEPE